MYKLIEVSGPDAATFLQGQLTQDIDKLADTGRLLAAWCNPRGRVIVTARLISLDAGIGLQVPADIAADLVERLATFRFRSKVDFQIADIPEGILSNDELDISSLIEAGCPLIDGSNSEKFTPHMLNLDKLGAISFTKGCYTGQEIVARTENLGKSRRRLMRYEADAAGISVGDKLTLGERSIGEVVNVADTKLLAVTPIDVHDQALRADGRNVVPTGLPYAL